MKEEEMIDNEPKTSYELFGVECGNGWKPLIDRYFKWIEEYNNDKSEENKIETLQIKEKFGSLRIYPSSYTDELHNLIEKLEEESSNICEECGKHIEEPIIKNHWIYPLCEDCFNSMEERRKKVMDEFWKKWKEIQKK